MDPGAGPSLRDVGGGGGAPLHSVAPGHREEGEAARVAQTQRTPCDAFKNTGAIIVVWKRRAISDGGARTTKNSYTIYNKILCLDITANTLILASCGQAGYSKFALRV